MPAGYGARASVRRGPLVRLLAYTVVAFAIGAVVALAVPWLPSPASREAGRIWFVYWFTIWICVAIFALVAAVLLYALLNFRVKEGDLSDGPPVHGHTAGILELPCATSHRAPLGEGIPRRRQLLDSVIAGIRHIDVALLI
mgnify:CR=1 FL=1